MSLYIFRITLVTMAVWFVVITASHLVRAETTPEIVNPLALRKIMHQMAKDMQRITGGIAHEDWALVTEIAPQIADHPQPPLSEKMRILAFVGTDTSKFKGHDKKTHQAAQELKVAAARQDGLAVISAFAALQNSCLACHQSFRKAFKEHFYE